MIFKASINNGGASGLEIWVPAIVSIITLIVNVVFYIFVQPNITNTISAKDDLKRISISFLDYLAEVVSLPVFDGVPTKIRQHSLKIHLCFKAGTAPSPIDTQLENLYQEAQKRKTITDQNEINQWNMNFRMLVRELRIELAKYCGAL